MACMFMVMSVYQFWLAWPSLIIASLQWQREVNSELADLLYDAQAHPWMAGGYLVGVSFLYGMLHSLGPGHGKVIVTTYLATHPTKVKNSLLLTTFSALCQALVAIALVSILLWGFNSSMRVVNQQANFFVSLSFALVVMLGCLICWKAARKLYRTMRPVKIKFVRMTPLTIKAGSDQSLLGNKNGVYPLTQRAPLVMSNQQKTNMEICGCGHQHVASAKAINNAANWREYVGIVVSIGIRPCTGAIMVLLFANMVGLYWMGVASAIVMAIGTAFTTSIIAVMTLTSKQLVKRYLTASKRNTNPNWVYVGYFLQFIGGVLLIMLGLILIGGQSYGMSPIL
ncbi:nickel/cobalt transporter [Vibrio sp. EA2]|uniref:nickel/cobalt transporter n=1 Tax=Vibrio sp. EA2 TaxID=3079860 RepID=UPI0029495414|nr:nickel/cobalt transporter [Vibrio sp. EA2]MDV6254265.1 nickel/cobalt transporter [Vibrio sp. EA2]